MVALLALLMVVAAAVVAVGTARVLGRLGIEPMPALIWLGVAEWAPGRPDVEPWMERFDAGLVALASGPAPGARAREWAVACSAALAGVLQAVSAPRLDA